MPSHRHGQSRAMRAEVAAEREASSRKHPIYGKLHALSWLAFAGHSHHNQSAVRNRTEEYGAALRSPAHSRGARADGGVPQRCKQRAGADDAPPPLSTTQTAARSIPVGAKPQLLISSMAGMATAANEDGSADEAGCSQLPFCCRLSSPRPVAARHQEPPRIGSLTCRLCAALCARVSLGMVMGRRQ